MPYAISSAITLFCFWLLLSGYFTPFLLAAGAGCAVAVAAYRTRGVKSPMTVSLPGGELQVEVDPKLNVVMTGPAAEVYSGMLSEEFINRLKEL